MAADIFQFEDYKDYLRERIREQPSRWGVIRKLAEAAGCQRSHLSQVITPRVHLTHLTKDQAYGVAAYWQLNALETEYFLLLVESARSGSAAYRTHLSAKLRQLRRENSNIAKKLKTAKPLSSQVSALYYSAWYWAAIHIGTSIEGGQSESELAARLQLPLALVLNCLKRLHEFGMVAKGPKKWTFVGGNIHLPSGSPLLIAHNQNWRVRAAIDAPVSRDQSVHYSALHAISRQTYEEIKNLTLNLISQNHKLSEPSASQELVCLNIDLFKV